MSGFDMDSIAQAAGLRNEPVQARSTRTLDSLKAAALEVLAEYGFDEFSTALVAERSRKSIGTVYRYFPDREALLDAVVPGRRQTHELLFQRIEQAEQVDLDDGPIELMEQARLHADGYRMDVSLGAENQLGERGTLLDAVSLMLAALEAHDREVRRMELALGADK